MPEQHRFLRGMVSWVGFKQIGVSYKRHPRYAGSSTFTLGKMVRFALDAITGFSYAPLQLASYLGFTIALLSALAIMAVVALRLLGSSQPLLGQATTLVTVLFLGGVQLICLGIVGEYLGRIYDEVKRRPLYLIDQRWGLTKARCAGNASHIRSLNMLTGSGARPSFALDLRVSAHDIGGKLLVIALIVAVVSFLSRVTRPLQARLVARRKPSPPAST